MALLKQVLHSLEDNSSVHYARPYNVCDDVMFISLVANFFPVGELAFAVRSFNMFDNKSMLFRASYIVVIPQAHRDVGPGDGLCLVGAETSDLLCCCGHAVSAYGGGGIAAVEEKAVDDGRSRRSHGVAEETVVERGVGGEVREKEVQIGGICTIGLKVSVSVQT